jgi:hypothetical protein
VRFYWSVRRIGGRKSHPGLHRVRMNGRLMPAVNEKINRPAE